MESVWGARSTNAAPQQQTTIAEKPLRRSENAAAIQTADATASTAEGEAVGMRSSKPQQRARARLVSGLAPQQIHLAEQVASGQVPEHQPPVVPRRQQQLWVPRMDLNHYHLRNVTHLPQNRKGVEGSTQSTEHGVI